MKQSLFFMIVLGCALGVEPRQPSPQLPLNISGNLLVANQRSASATLVNLGSGDTKNIPVGDGPHETAISPDGRIGVVTVYGLQTPGNQLAVIDMVAGRVTRTVSLDSYVRPHGVVFLPGDNERVLVTSEATQNVVIVNVVRGAIDGAIGTDAMGSHMVAVTADGRRAFTANIGSGSASELDVANRKLVRVIPVASRTEGIAVVPDGSTVWVGSNTSGTVSVVETATGTIATTLQGFRLPYRLAISADGRLAIICDPDGDQIHEVDVAQRKVTWSLGSLGAPRGVTIAPDGSTAFITLNGDRSVAVVNLATRQVLRKFAVGESPDGVAFGPPPR